MRLCLLIFFLGIYFCLHAQDNNIRGGLDGFYSSSKSIQMIVGEHIHSKVIDLGKQFYFYKAGFLQFENQKRNQQSFKKYFFIFPNPAHDFILVRLLLPFKVEKIVISDISGRVILRYDSMSELNIRALKRGTYVISIISTDKQSFSETFIKL